MPGTLVLFGTTYTSRSVTIASESTGRCATDLEIASAEQALVKYQCLGYKVRFRELDVRVSAECCEPSGTRRKISPWDLGKFQG